MPSKTLLICNRRIKKIEMMKNKIQNLTGIALMAAILCVVGPLIIPIGIVPISLTNMVIYLSILLWEQKKACISVIIYLLIGLVGVPVFSGFGAGVGKLFGPTGGYLLGYLLLSWISGMILKKLKRKDQNMLNCCTKYNKEKIHRFVKVGKEMAALVTGTIGLYIFGTFWLMFQSNMTFENALFVGVLPFIAFDIIKMILAISLADSIKKRVKFIL